MLGFKEKGLAAFESALLYLFVSDFFVLDMSKG